MSPIFVDNAMARLLSLYESKSKAVSSTAKAALVQLFSHVINDLITDKTKGEDEFDSEEEVKGSATIKNSQGKSNQSDLTLLIASKLLSGLVSHLNPDKKTEWPVPVNNSTS